MGAIVVTSNVTYKTGLQLDVYRPGTLTNRPALLLIHGGGWQGGDKADTGHVLAATEFAKRGFVVFSVNYTLVPPGNRTSNFRQPPIDDVGDAVAWVRSNAATYGVDSTKVAIFGRSAGGHLGLMVGFTKTGSSRPDAVLCWSAPTKLEDFDFTPATGSREELAWDYIGVADLADAAMDTFSPYYNVGAGDPPIRLAHKQDEGDLAFGVPVSNADDMHTAALAAGVDSTKVILSGNVHDDFPTDYDPATIWLQETLGYSVQVLVVSIAVTDDDGHIDRSASVGSSEWPPAGSFSVSTTTINLLARKARNDSFNALSLYNTFLFFDTSALPDDAIVLAAELYLQTIALGANTDRNVVAGWYDGANRPIDSSDWSGADNPGSDAGSWPITNFVADTEEVLTLGAVSSILRTGYSGLRFAIDGGQPAPGNTDWRVEWASLDHTTKTEPQMLITFTMPKQSFYASRRRSWR